MKSQQTYVMVLFIVTENLQMHWEQLPRLSSIQQSGYKQTFSGHLSASAIFLLKLCLKSSILFWWAVIICSLQVDMLEQV